MNFGPPPHPPPLARVLLALIAAYRWTAAVRTGRCRFLPTCSAYAADAIRKHGSLQGTALAVRRIGRCHPWNPGGLDPVPPADERLRFFRAPASRPTQREAARS